MGKWDTIFLLYLQFRRKKKIAQRFEETPFEFNGEEEEEKIVYNKRERLVEISIRKLKCKLIGKKNVW